MPRPAGNGWSRDEKVVILRIDRIEARLDKLDQEQRERERRRWGDVRSILMLLAGGAVAQLIAYVVGKM